MCCKVIHLTALLFISRVSFGIFLRNLIFFYLIPKFSSNFLFFNRIELLFRQFYLRESHLIAIFFYILSNIFQWSSVFIEIAVNWLIEAIITLISNAYYPLKFSIVNSLHPQAIYRDHSHIFLKISIMLQSNLFSSSTPPPLYYFYCFDIDKTR